MHLTDHDLRQLDHEAISRLRDESVRRLAERLLEDLKEARDRLRQDSRNSSRPPSSDSVYGRSRREDEGDGDPEDPPDKESPASAGKDQDAAESGESATDTKDAASPGQPDSAPGKACVKRHAGHQPGAPGVGRTQKLAVDVVIDHRPEGCTVCGAPFPADAPGQSCGGYDEIDLMAADPNAPGLRLWVTQHRFFERNCADPCGHHSRYVPLRAVVQPEWEGVGVADQQMVGPRLAGLIVLLCLRYRLSRSKVSEVLQELIGLHLSTGLIDRTLRQSAGQVAPVEDLLVAEIERAGLLHVDETPWLEQGQLLWLWVFSTLTTVVYFIGWRSAEVFVNTLQGGFSGCLMSDGYAVYRSYLNRVRCLAHLLRKARGLSEATCRHTRQVGQQLLTLIKHLMQAAKAARTGSRAGLAGQQAPRLAELKALCETHQHSTATKLGKFCRELLNDWAAIERPLLDPSLPLTNNAAERQLRHWVIARKTSFGTRSEQGSRALALLASILDTCRARHASSWEYLTAAISAGRQQLPMPPLPTVQQAGG